MRSTTLALFFLTHLAILSQKKYPTNYFRSPLNIPLKLSGTFGELRNNHFHAGIDLKTKQRSGLKVYAVADGYVSRIKVSLWGYGKVIYINHPNGYTSVYAHLSKFGEGIQEYVKNIQYKKQRYETGNIFLDKNKIIVKKGQVIAFTGRTGGFVAPHLHYEIRDTKTEKVINPLLFGLKIQDTIAPRIQKLIAYPLGPNSTINASTKKQILGIKRNAENSYITNRISASGKVSFGLGVYDLLGKESNKNGVFSIEMLVNGKRHYYHDVETFSFSETKFINLHIDYPYFSRYKSRIQKTFVEEENRLSIYDGSINKGVVNIQEGLNYQIELIVSDFSGNTSSVKIPVLGVKKSSTWKKHSPETAQFKIVKNEFQKFTNNGISIAFPKNTFYKDTHINFSVNGAVATVHKPNIPLNKKFTISFDSTLYKSSEADKIYIANISNKKYPYPLRTRKRSDKLFATTKVLGNYALLTDKQKPKIYSPNFNDGDWVSKLKYLTIKISDFQSGIRLFNAYIDDDWILMEYDVKNKKLSYDFSDKKLVGSKHTFKLIVSDNVGNTNTYSSTFYRK